MLSITEFQDNATRKITLDDACVSAHASSAATSTSSDSATKTYTTKLHGAKAALPAA
jgi:hypothetical protein